MLLSPGGRDPGLIGRSVLSTDLAGQGLPWLFSISSQGGAGKTYLLNLVQQNYASRLLAAPLDHVDYAEAKADLINLLAILAARFRSAGCATPIFDKFTGNWPRTGEAEKKHRKVDLARDVAGWSAARPPGKSPCNSAILSINSGLLNTCRG